jgi:hypothetical protein
MSTMQGRLWSRLSEGGPSIRLVDFPVSIQISSDSVPSTPSWFGEVTVIAHFLKCQGVLAAIEERVCFARRRFGRYDVIDFVAVLLGAISGEPTLEMFYEREQPDHSRFSCCRYEVDLVECA